MEYLRFKGEHEWDLPQPDPNLEKAYRFERANDYTQAVNDADAKKLMALYPDDFEIVPKPKEG